MTYKWYLLAVLALPFPVHAQTKSNSFNFVLPDHYSILDTASADFNNDSYRDFIVVLKSNSEETNPDTTRPLFILMGTKDGKLIEFARNDKIVFCKSCGGVMGDPYEGISVKGIYFSIDHYGGSSWRWTRNITFKFVKAQNIFVLHKDGGISYHASDPDKTETYFERKSDFDTLPFSEYDYDNSKKD